MAAGGTSPGLPRRLPHDLQTSEGGPCSRSSAGCSRT